MSIVQAANNGEYYFLNNPFPDIEKQPAVFSLFATLIAFQNIYWLPLKRFIYNS